MLHGIILHDPLRAYARLESGDDVLCYSPIKSNFSTIFRAFSSVAVIVEDAVRSLEESTDDDVFTYRPGGSLGALYWDTMLAVDNEVSRY